MECVHHYVLKPGYSAVGECKHCSDVRTFDNEYRYNPVWVNPLNKQGSPEVTAQKTQS